MRDRDVENSYSDAENIQRLERLLDGMKIGKPFEIQVAGKRTPPSVGGGYVARCWRPGEAT
ncbi:MAG: hypothetical protein RLO46_05150 [Pseudomonadales bacterium]